MLLVVQNYPQVVVIDPAPLSVTTFTNRYRDAVRGLLEYNQIPKEMPFTVEAYDSANAQGVVVAEYKGQVLIGSREAIKCHKQKKLPAGKLIMAEVSELAEIDSDSEEVIKSICTLLKHKYLMTATLYQVDLDKVNPFIQNTEIQAFENGNNIHLFIE